MGYAKPLGVPGCGLVWTLALGLTLLIWPAHASIAHAQTTFQLSGHVLYNGDPARPVPATTMVLRDAAGHETVTYTDATGYYAFDSSGALDGWATPWTLTPQRVMRYGERNDAISSLDAAYALQIAVGLRPLPGGIADAACDVTGGGGVSSLDAARILQYKVGVEGPFARCGGEWAFSPSDASGSSATLVEFSAATCTEGAAELASGGGSLPNATVNFDATAFGDCTGNWTPSEQPAPWTQNLVPPLGSHFTYGAITRAIAVDAQSNVIAAGETVGDVDIVGTLASVEHGIFITKLTKSGQPLWTVVWPRPSAGTVEDIATDPSGNIVVTGAQFGETSYADGSFISPNGDKRVYVTKLSGLNGSVIWTKAFGSAGQEQPGGIAVTGNGTIVFGLSFSGILNVGGGSRVADGSLDGLVVALSPSGQHLWDFVVQGAGANTVTAVFASGNDVVVGGWFAETLEVESTLETVGGYDAFVLELNGAGTLLNSVHLGGTGYEYVDNVARGPAGELAVVGNTSGTDFPEPKSTSSQDSDAFVAVLSAGGTSGWGRRLGADYSDSAFSVTFDPAGDVIVGGRFGTSVDFGGVTLTSPGQHDGFVAKYDGADGALQWAERIGGSSLFDSDSVRAVTASDQGIFIGGQFNTEFTWLGLNQGVPGNRAGFIRRFDP